MQSIKTVFWFIYLSFIIYTAVGNDKGPTEKTACIGQILTVSSVFFSYFLISSCDNVFFLLRSS